ncbi:hypothetical protein BBO99_00007954 [Phytophthora kernoviae]|uniref:Uncharacterized protein n=2 Tax=Phytophthora kernoviae TaxID=325452 RepID=A0A3F2RI77_9STRA|nr:hypothetical protein G195_010040 [Phytophthora kernoviae 00238/432]KAG2514171.1 hypothetical protein JM18_008379 [Phytophthora kernoviae]KAG2519721.1 hypothetical protein JM16_007025 [Phytophthora kernoviae]RLN14714.1 hypothetical protein BBI17_007355 [Phytophthora kernoviae]RLN56477.1 hypothetical protein BBP00_00007974 [Phytophthora kernoviae]
MLRRSVGTCGSRICRQIAVQTREKITIPAAAGAGGTARRRRLKPKMSKDKFAKLSTEFLDRVQTAMEPLHPPVNEDFQLQRDGDGGLVVCTNDKEFVLEVLPAKQQLQFTSPVSGLRTYEWNAMTKRWEDEVMLPSAPSDVGAARYMLIPYLLL